MFVDWMLYLGALTGAMMEGEVAILTSLQLSRLGKANFYGILIAGFIGTLFMDWLMYLNGRYYGRAYLKKRPKMQAQLQRLEPYMQRFGDWLLLLYRFMYGLRYGLTLLFGLHDIPLKKFAFFSILSTTIWISLLGVFGHYLANWLGIA
ncbi:MAG: VTT domain-containing protein [Saprospiraceae bacterium]|nr:VTT domain-containing protein [Saprospiraceae bacterium]